MPKQELKRGNESLLPLLAVPLAQSSGKRGRTAPEATIRYQRTRHSHSRNPSRAGRGFSTIVVRRMCTGEMLFNHFDIADANCPNVVTNHQWTRPLVALYPRARQMVMNTGTRQFTRILHTAILGNPSRLPPRPPDCYIPWTSFISASSRHPWLARWSSRTMR